jgi:hypothetical protein
MARTLGRVVVSVFLLLGIPAAAQATVITFEAIDLQDVVAGDDLWQYRYAVSGRVFDPFEGFTIFFDPAVVSAVDPVVAPPNGDWDVLVLFPGAPGGGFAYDALALAANASLANLFVVNFVVAAGVGIPGSQLFEVNAFDQNLNFLGVLESGTTTPAPTPVPEPGTLLLLGAGLALLTLKSRRGHDR